MATTYRAVIKTDEYARRDQIAYTWSRVVRRGSAATDRTMLAMFRVSLSRRVPIGPKAEAWLERSGSTGLQMIVRCKGARAATATGRDGYSLVSDGGDWVTLDGEILAHAGR